MLHHCRLLAHVSRWLEARNLGASALNAELAEGFLAERHAAGHQVPLRIGSLEPLLDHLHALGVAGVPEPVRAAGAAEAVLARFAGYLAGELVSRSRRSPGGRSSSARSWRDWRTAAAWTWGP